MGAVLTITYGHTFRFSFGTEPNCATETSACDLDISRHHSPGERRESGAAFRLLIEFACYHFELFEECSRGALGFSQNHMLKGSVAKYTIALKNLISLSIMSPCDQSKDNPIVYRISILKTHGLN